VVNKQASSRISPYVCTRLNKYEHGVSSMNMACLSVIHARWIREVHVRGMGYAPQGRPARH